MPGWYRNGPVEQLSDGNYIIAGYTNSNDGDVTGNHGYYDAWIVKVDTSGNIIWQKCFGGTGLDEALSVQQTTDAGFIVCGLSASTDGNLTGNQGGYDYWVIKLDGNGNLLWQKNFGGSGDDYGHKAVQTSDGGYIVTGMSGSNDGDVSGNHGNNDLWTVKLDSGGNIEWKKCLGGSEEEGATAIEQTTDGGFIIAGYSASNNGDVTGNHGGLDFWLVKLNSSGNITWQKSLGGSGLEIARSIQQTADGGYLCSGSSGSNNGDVSGNHGAEDGWIVKLNSSGTVEWQKCIGGNSDDDARSVNPTPDGGYFSGGYTFSAGGDVTGNHGQSDVWAVKLTGTLNSPFFDPDSAASVSAITFTITALPGSTIYYTTDGSTPDCNSSQFGLSPLLLTTPSSTGIYEYKAIACLTDWIPSAVTSGYFHVTPTSTADPTDIGSGIIIYPNPTTGLIQLTPGNTQIETIILINSQGQMMDCTLQAGKDRIINLSSHPKGIYLIKITGKDNFSGNFTEQSFNLVIQ